MERRRYAEMVFYEGILHFGYPREWIKKAEEGNVGQGEQTKPAGREGDCVEYDMSEAYAQDFSGEETWENRFKTGFHDRKAMVVIHRPQVFLDKVKEMLRGGQDVALGSSLEDCAMLKSHFYKGVEKCPAELGILIMSLQEFLMDEGAPYDFVW